MSDFMIRPATPADVPAILACIKGIAAYEKMSDDVVATEQSVHCAMFEENVTHCLMAEENGEIVGFALYFYNYSTFTGVKGLYLEDLFLYPEHRKKGYGKKLIEVLFKIAVDENCGRMEWVCLDWNTPSINFYKSLGAVPMDGWSTWRLTRDQLIALTK